MEGSTITIARWELYAMIAAIVLGPLIVNEAPLLSDEAPQDLVRRVHRLVEHLERGDDDLRRLVHLAVGEVRLGEHRLDEGAGHLVLLDRRRAKAVGRQPNRCWRNLG